MMVLCRDLLSSQVPRQRRVESYRDLSVWSQQVNKLTLDQRRDLAQVKTGRRLCASLRPKQVQERRDG